MNRYLNGKIYRLVNNIDQEFYVGSCCCPLAKRKNQHKSKAKTHSSRQIYKHINKIGWDNVEIILIEEVPCENKMELLRRERYWIETLKPTLNKLLPLEYADKATEHYFKARLATRIQCLCGKEYSLQHKYRHLKTNQHLKNIL